MVAALQRERHVLAADGRINADIDLPQLSRQTVGEHLRFDDTDPGRGELRLDEGDQRLEKSLVRFGTDCCVRSYRGV